MAKVIPIIERSQHFVEELRESFWGARSGSSFDCHTFEKATQTA